MMDRWIVAEHVRDNFQATDRLAVVLLDKRNDAVIQRLASAAQVASPEFQAWLRHKNAQRYDVYVSMNALRPEAMGRTKADIGAVRHIYLDFDENGTEAVDRLMHRSDLPRPNYRLNSSPGKWQVAWKAEGFAPDHAERLQRALAQETGADPAATDCARVLRLPGFYNHKYETPHFITAETLSTKTYVPDDFPSPALGQNSALLTRDRTKKDEALGLSQSERDWAFAKRALARGESEELVIAAIAVHRRFDKHNPQYYAELTVRKAARSLTEELSTPDLRGQEYDR
jgi:hypothetical protein